jgi:hypothetical protein
MNEQVPHASKAFHEGDITAKQHLAYPAAPLPDTLRELMGAAQPSANGAFLNVCYKARNGLRWHADDRGVAGVEEEEDEITTIVFDNFGETAVGFAPTS